MTQPPYKYLQLSLHQRISLKGLFTSKKERLDIGVKNDDNYFMGLCALALFDGWKGAIEFYLNN